MQRKGYILIRMKSRAKIGNKELNGKVICKDGVCLTTFDDPKQTKKTYEAMKKEGKEVALEGNILVEMIKGAKKEEIAEKIIKEMQVLSKNLSPLMEITYQVEKK